MMENAPYLQGQLLVAMPGIGDPRFDRSVIFMCSHSAEGAMGLVINKPFTALTLPQLLDQLEIEVPETPMRLMVHSGGPVEQVRGFVLHSDEYTRESTLHIAPGYALTATLEVLRDVATGKGPERRVIALGYAGWGPGQLDRELARNGWLMAEATDDLVFGDDLDLKWPRAIATLGFDVGMLSAQAGHA
jgi:putative transcriptional regulator